MRNKLARDVRRGKRSRLRLTLVELEERIVLSTYAEALNGGGLTITQEAAANDSLRLSVSGGTYTLTDTSGFLFDTPTGDGAASISGAGTQTITIPAANVSSITVVLGTGSNVFNLAGTNGASAAPITVNTGTTTTDQINITGAVLDTAGISLTSGGAIVESGAGALATTHALATSSTRGTTLNGLNAIGSFSVSNTTSGNVSLTNTSAPLTVAGINEVNGGTVTIHNTGDLTFSNALDGAYALNTNSSGLTTFSAAVGNSAPLTSLSITTATLTAGTIATTGGITINDSGAGSITGGIFGGSSTALIKAGAGTLTLSGASTYAGATTINAGTLQAGAAGAIPAGTAAILANVAGATLDLNNFDVTIGTISGGGATGGNITLGSGTLTASSGNFGGVISGTGGLTKAGTGNLALAGANTYTGTTTISAGVLQIGVGGPTGSLGSGPVIDNGTLVFGGTSNLIVADAISGTGSLTQDDPGTVSLSERRHSTRVRTSINAGAYCRQWLHNERHHPPERHHARRQRHDHRERHEQLGSTA